METRCHQSTTCDPPNGTVLRAVTISLWENSRVLLWGYQRLGVSQSINSSWSNAITTISSHTTTKGTTTKPGRGGTTVYEEERKALTLYSPPISFFLSLSLYTNRLFWKPPHLQRIHLLISVCLYVSLSLILPLSPSCMRKHISQLFVKPRSLPSSLYTLHTHTLLPTDPLLLGNPK